jgi:hypothetical protein
LENKGGRRIRVAVALRDVNDASLRHIDPPYMQAGLFEQLDAAVVMSYGKMLLHAAVHSSTLAVLAERKS